MFHRVKSETPSEPKQAQQEKSQQLAWNADADADADDSDIEIEEEVAESSSEDDTENNQTPVQFQKEETENMTESETGSRAAAQPQQPEAAMKSRPQMPVGSYARSAGSAVRPAGYPGAYPGVSYGAPAASASAHDAGRQDRTLTIGAGITMSGEIESCDNLIVEGTVEAALKGARNLDIAESGTFYGTVEIEEAVIAGRFEGELNVTGRLTLRSGGVITGTIAYGELEIEAGAIIDGRLTPFIASQAGEAHAPKASASAPKAAASKPAAPAPKAKAPANADADGELFAAKA